jgi:hypothetical protein
MPFTAYCPFCPAKLANLPDKSLGAPVRCPKCGSNFRAAPREESVPAGARSTTAPEPSGETNDDMWTRMLNAPPKDKAGGAVAALFAGLSALTTGMPRWINIWGLSGFVVGSLAFMLAAVGALRTMTIPLAGAGLLVVVLGAYKRLGRFKRRDLIWLPLGGFVTSVVFLLALFRPDWLNAQWGMDFTLAEPDLNKMLLVSRDNKTVLKELEDADWADARQNAIRQEDFLVRIDSVAVVESPGKGVSANVLRVGMHFTNVSPVRRIVYEGEKKRKQPAVARDNRGQALKPVDTASENKGIGQVGLVSLMPFQETKDMLLFEAPATGLEFVELEFPASAWGRQGVCRFRIPRAMIRGLAEASGGGP